jgi:hypothetical protein
MNVNQIADMRSKLKPATGTNSNKDPQIKGKK